MNLHPIIKTELNDEQQKAVMQMKNAVIAAGAGSGKTRVLAYRYAHLVIEYGFEVDTILTLTFTKKATAEMYERIYSTLKEIASSNLSNDVQKRRAQNAIENFHSARIQTIDSFCSGIVRGASREYGIRPDFTIDNDGVKDFCKKRALDFMLKYRNLSAMQDIINNERFENMVDALFVNTVFNFSSIAHEVCFSDFLTNQIELVTFEWKKNIEKVLCNRHAFVEVNENHKATFTCIEQHCIDDIALKKYFLIMKDECDTFEQRIPIINTIKKDVIAYLGAIYTLTKLNKREKQNKIIEQEINLLKEAYEVLTALSQYVLYFAHTLELFPVLQEFKDEITEWKRSSGCLTYSDVSSLALRVLLENPKIRYSEKIKTNAIMIDEFQDNNAMQKDMLFLLAEHFERKDKTVPIASELCPEKLFFVGDEKQSIYKFRGADVSIFRELKNDLNETLTLSANYRSHAQLIAGFNSIFGGYEYVGSRGAFDATVKLEKEQYAPSVFLQDFQLAEGINFPIFEAEYTKVVAKETTEADRDNKRIHICLLDTSKNEEVIDVENTENEEEKEDFLEAETLAIFTAEKIAELCKETYNPADIAILFRSYGNQSMYEKHLRRLGIPYVAENITNFFGDAPVNDIIAFIRLLVYPKDINALSTLLRSPFVRLSQQEFLSCLLLTEKLSSNELFCEDLAINLSEESRQRYETTLQRYKTLREKVHYYSCAQIVHELWYSDGYRYETMWNEDVSLFSESYDYLFDIARNIDLDGKNITYFIDYLYELDKNSERLDDMNIPLERSGAVQLMSIHKSKGLEFPVVFVVGVSKTGKGTKNTEKVYMDSVYGPSINFPALTEIKDSQKNYFFNKGKILEKQMNEAELRRVLYVAMTRAEKELYITGSYSINKETKKALEKDGVDISSLTGDDIYIVLSKIFEEKVKSKSRDKNNSQVLYNYCIQNNSLFAFLLPIIASYSEKESPFILHTIESKTRNELQKADNDRKNILVEAVQKRLSPIYDVATVISTPFLKSPYRSPSQLGVTSDFEVKKNDNFDKGEHAIKELDTIIASKKDDLFYYSHFGTLCHAYAESIFTKKKPIIHADIINALDEKEFEIICTIAEDMTERFSTSDIGRDALSSKWQKTEHNFKLLLRKDTVESVIIKGQIDLLYERHDGTIVILDYKTDSVEEPEHHIAQLAAYKKAVTGIYGKADSEVLCILYYLRTGNSIDVTDKIKHVDLLALAFSQ